ncbi:3'-5' exonuclease [Leadbettera azotonutricia]|uniref:DNA polymerase III, epsilon subunit n=1 Tax=Leadbettera azotonutricia (strain ATCC BAA-888 / DSM 13862 / ZAS-9) TaxID=545695 RepID=F5Y8U6_LEAAZ|nr:3'-5' exonuclease [Leadbettera azotonutricia]AEF83465.1 DNA polymerase III, epsilon subunit [Leadbettera azotonutricia ZAS-9]
MGTYDDARALYAENGVFAAFDLETTGLDAQKDQIVEIGAVKFDRRGLIARFSTLINPGIPMPPEAGKVNNITDSMLKDQPMLDEVLPDFIRFIKNTILIAHNAPFDCGFINAKLKEKRAWTPPFSSLPNRVLDTLVFSRETFPGRRTYKLGDLARDLEIPMGDAHRAEDDAAACMEIFLRCIAASGV